MSFIKRPLEGSVQNFWDSPRKYGWIRMRRERKLRNYGYLTVKACLKRKKILFGTVAFLKDFL